VVRACSETEHRSRTSTVIRRTAVYAGVTADAGGAESLAQQRWAPVFDRHRVDLLVAFGSAVDPARSADAEDLDVAVVLRPGADRLAVTTGLMELVEYDRVDVMDLRRASQTGRVEALVRGVPLYEREDGDFAREQMAAVGVYLDTEWLRRWNLELLAE
jgi:predicted nucleotidyltransferase